MNPLIAPIVEGKSEIAAVPILLRRLLQRIGAHHVGVLRPYRVKQNRIGKEGELERAVQQATKSHEGARAVLVLLDADDDCPAKLGPQLLARCRRATALPTAVVVANREFEAWFLGAKVSLRGTRGIADDATPPSHPEAIRGAKEHLNQNMLGRTYVPVADQPALAETMSLHAAEQACPSFAKLVRDLQHLVWRMGP